MSSIRTVLVLDWQLGIKALLIISMRVNYKFLEAALFLSLNKVIFKWLRSVCIRWTCEPGLTDLLGKHIEAVQCGFPPLCEIVLKGVAA